jgi:hypothetical protein
MIRRFTRPACWRRTLWLWLLAGLILVFLPAAGAAPLGVGPAPQTGQPSLQGADVVIEGGYTIEGQAGPRIESRILSLPANQANIVYLSPPVQAPFPFSDVAPSWDTPSPPPDVTAESDSIRVDVRTSPDGATWTGWQASDLEDIIDPRDPVTRTYASLVGVPQDARTHRFAQARITLTSAPGAAPPQLSNLRFSFVDAGVTTQVPVAEISGGPPPVKPAVISRRSWGAPDGNSSPNWPPEYRRVTHIIVHHTETSNTDTDFAARVRAIWYYHAVTRNWGDIGYNYLIDPRGNVYEGRFGGDDVVAGHAYPFNYGSLGVALIGNYDTAPPPSAMRDSLIKLLAWETDRRGIDPQGAGPFTGALDCGGSVTLVRPNIAGHRDFRGVGCGREFNAKTCPGSYAYALLPTIRAAIGVTMPPYRAVFEANNSPTTLAPGAVGRATITARNAGGLTWPRGGPNPVHLGYHWYTLAGDLITSGYADIRTDLPADVPYGGRVTLAANVGAPTAPGTYDLRWDMVHELKTWFADAGSTALSVRVVVAQGDKAPPQAGVTALPPYQGDAQFVVRWAGADEPGGSGLASYDVQYRVGVLGAWIDWQTATAGTSSVFTGGDGYTYFFRARARDKAGNTAAYPTEANTQTTVILRPPSLMIRSPQDGQRVPPGALQVIGSADPGTLVRVNGGPATVAANGVFTTTIAVEGADSPITVEVQGLSGKIARTGILVHAGGRFSDVPFGHWAFDAIEYLSGLGVISGYDDTTFRPNTAVTRAQYMKMLSVALRWGAVAPRTPRFSDVPPDFWGAPFVEAAASRGLITGYAGGAFQPNDPITRAQVVKVLTLAANWPLQQGSVSPFADVPLTYWAYPYLETAYRHGVLQDNTNGVFRPDAPATRAEVSLALYYALGDLASSGRWP